MRHGYGIDEARREMAWAWRSNSSHQALVAFIKPVIDLGD
jgi:hypothetical protein